jgi:mRNA interferase RelE/StbE
VTTPQPRYELQFSPSALRQLGKLSQDVRLRIRTATEALRDEPRPHGAIKLTGADDRWRIRLGDYRVIYTVVDRILVVTVVEIGHRRDIYRRR